MKNIKEKENRGGARKGAGRKPKPPKEFSVDFKISLMNALETKRIETGKSYCDIFAELLYGDELKNSAKCSLWKILADILTIKETKKEIIINENKAMVFLPTIMEKSENLIDVNVNE